MSNILCNMIYKKNFLFLYYNLFYLDFANIYKDNYNRNIKKYVKYFIIILKKLNL